MRESVDHLARVRRRIAGIAREDRNRPDGRFSTGHEELDAMLEGGFARARLHEFFALDVGDCASAAGFATMLAIRATETEAPLLWLRCDDARRRSGDIYAPGVAELGSDPNRLILAMAPDAVALLRGAADAARCSGLPVLVVECWGKCPALDLTASRRLALAAERSGTTVIMLRADAKPSPSAAETRWAVRAARSAGEAGLPAFEIELLRRRSGPAGMRWHLEWNRDQSIFRDPALSGDLVSRSSRGSAATSAAA
ncbi:ImuA family protein [Sphingomonas edaphi]|jgi:protein ImuA|uniref:ImuA family protein n=1 Tax=Sphingomonas edaphi TaxID=2315689 RepID=UPI001F2E2803|nr:hypothetical protein [Sphingomonas edaphi]